MGALGAGVPPGEVGAARALNGSSAASWVALYRLYNSGLYNNQWMVLDYNRILPGQPPRDGAFWIFEQIPGGGEAADMTWWLRREGYWASYNIPYIREIYEKSGYPSQPATPENDYYNCSRHNIFQRDAVPLLFSLSL